MAITSDACVLEEINALSENHTSDLVDLPKEKKVVGVNGSL